MTSQPKKLFVSSSLTESSLAAEVITQLSNAFKGALGFDHARDLGAGDMWKAWIRKSLNDCDAGLFLVTPRYLASQWLSAEFTAFWVSEKPIFILLFPGVESSDLFTPMRDDYQATAIDDTDGIKRFLTNLATLSGTQRVPFEHTDLISFRAHEAFKECEATQPRDPGIVDPSSQVPDVATYPRRHLLMDSTWDLELGADGDSLRATSTRTEHFVCQSPVMHYVPVVVAQAANILPFQAEAGFDVELLGYEYPRGRVAISKKSIVPGGNYSFQLDFHPPLTDGTEVQVHYRFTIPALKVESPRVLWRLG
ncbi:MAG TPA: toll/interleukin-1 receptor domain-containing protein [Arachnia sp.]|nr:toll/interleukin-1 receptor domain-containing protein [Arachnia sp.]HMT85773.1 toll/interleukin-1 receptor domain-containing protein [Arachnia sp.]